MPKQKYYYLIAALAAAGGKQSNFTYYADQKLKAGHFVRMTLGKRQSFGVVIKEVPRPKFATKAIVQVSILPPLPNHLLSLATWISEYYATPLGRVCQTLLPSVPFLKKDVVPGYPPPKSNKVLPVKLVAQQKSALRHIQNGQSQNYLLYGITGSGKTQIYIELAQTAMTEGKSTIVLVPEISLTPQITQSFVAAFGERVSVTHSRLTPAKRRYLWQKVLTAKEPQIIIGPRSALFMPVPKLGYVVIDEAHDTSYKQDQSPRYQAPAVAAKLCHLANAKLILGTATPSVNDLFLAQAGRMQLITMPERIFKSTRARPVIIDLRQPELLSSSYLLSRPLLEAIAKTLSRGKQAILFLNRRGSARLLLCKHCGWTATCPRCQIPLTWHADTGKLRCHWCGFEQAPPPACPDCGHFELAFMGTGTKRLEAELTSQLPDARVARLDRDSLDVKSLDSFYAQLQSGQIDILVGTQMITKGLDLPGVETVGIVLADTMLYLPDFSAGERTFQLLYQVAGRAGRREGSIANTIIQTYSPQHPAILAAASGDFDSFMASEIEERKLLNYPPFVFLLKLAVSKPRRELAQAAAQELAVKLRKLAKVIVVGPAPAWQETLRGKYHWQIVIKAKDRDLLVKIAGDLPSGWTHDLDPLDLL